MTSFFCAFCAIRTDNNTIYSETLKAHVLHCPCCDIVIEFKIPQPPTKNFSEAQQEFLNTPLTEKQEYGSKSKFPRKKKVKAAGGDGNKTNHTTGKYRISYSGLFLPKPDHENENTSHLDN